MTEEMATLTILVLCAIRCMSLTTFNLHNGNGLPLFMSFLRSCALQICDLAVQIISFYCTAKFWRGIQSPRTITVLIILLCVFMGLARLVTFDLICVLILLLFSIAYDGCTYS